MITKVGLDTARGTYVELYNPSSQPVNLTGWTLQYVNQKGQVTTLKTISTDLVVPAGGALVVGDSRLTDEQADLRFDSQKVLAKTGGSVKLVMSDGRVSDLVGWGAVSAREGSPITLGGKLHAWRCQTNGVVTDTDNNVSDFSVGEAPHLRELPACTEPDEPRPPVDPTPPSNRCSGLKLHEIATNVDTPFIEIINAGTSDLDLTGCTILVKGRGKHKDTTHTFKNIELAAGALHVVRLAETNLKLAKTDAGEVYVLDESGNEIDQTSFTGLAKDSSWSLLDGEWKVTFSPTPARPNEFKQWPDCKAGYVRHELTGRCVKESVEPVPTPCRPGQYRSPETGRCRNIVNEPELAPCKPGQYRSSETGRCRNISKLKTQTPCREGYYRSEITGRCRSIAAAAAKTLKPCPDGKFRNPATGRCKKIAADSDVLKECAEGFERNPKTKRCRKVALATAPKTGFAPEQVKQVTGAMWGWWVLGGVSLLAVGYAGWQWRWEIGRAATRLKHAITRGKR
ncbi:hypothetical protein GWK74_04100 [Candidatus Saccharibacteria bacterium oral taxon 488]|nr:hypothetical protein GWK74_04100 [Candidatus Saccharibacteria bacterium oral taxon 488]